MSFQIDEDHILLSFDEQYEVFSELYLESWILHQLTHRDTLYNFLLPGSPPF